MDKPEPLFTRPYGSITYEKLNYSLSAYHPVFRAFKEDFCKRYKLHPCIGDNGRIEFERLVWDYWRWAYHLYDKKAPPIPDLEPYGVHISQRFCGWLEEQFNLFLLYKLNLEKALPQFAERYAGELQKIADGSKKGSENYDKNQSEFQHEHTNN